MAFIDDIKTLLEKNKNLILTGAPGTGKTYTAIKVAELIADSSGNKTFKELKDEGLVEFVQFHPSYDYTDFVEGLRPYEKDGDDEKDNGISFRREDGIFKKFCAAAKDNWYNSNLASETERKRVAARQALEDFVATSIDSASEFSTPDGKHNFKVSEDKNTKSRVILEYKKDTEDKSVSVSKKELTDIIVSFYDNKDKEETLDLSDYSKCANHLGHKTPQQSDTYIPGLAGGLKIIGEGLKFVTTPKEQKKNFVFIIDEINRGELNKIFGELFFSVDPDKRGDDYLVATQYQTLVRQEDDDFADGFFVPENVYIIGTMNDIDRSVVSMDFAIRRRFAWKEVYCDDTSNEILKQAFTTAFGKCKKTDPLYKKLVSTMTNINNAILNRDLNLGTAYQLGASYFTRSLQYYDPAKKNIDDVMTSLWDYHIKGVLFEYLRGVDNAEKTLDDLQDAFNNKVIYDQKGNVKK